MKQTTEPKRNRAQCLNCKEVIESTHTHQWVSCKCFRYNNTDLSDEVHGIWIDGGPVTRDSYVRWGGNMEDLRWVGEDE